LCTNSISRDEAKNNRPNPALGEVVIPKSARALLWHDHGTWKTGQANDAARHAHGTYEHAVLMHESKIFDEELKCQSVVVRVYTEEQSKLHRSTLVQALSLTFGCTDPLALRYMPERPNPNPDRASRTAMDGGYLKVVIGCQYYLNLTLWVHHFLFLALLFRFCCFIAYRFMLVGFHLFE
jgi:hypothetical protein